MADGMDQPKEELHLNANEAEHAQAAPTEQKNAAPAPGGGEGGGGGASGALQIATLSKPYVTLSLSRAYNLTCAVPP